MADLPLFWKACLWTFWNVDNCELWKQDSASQEPGALEVGKNYVPRRSQGLRWDDVEPLRIRTWGLARLGFEEDSVSVANITDRWFILHPDSRGVPSSLVTNSLPWRRLNSSIFFCRHLFKCTGNQALVPKSSPTVDVALTHHLCASAWSERVYGMQGKWKSTNQSHDSHVCGGPVLGIAAGFLIHISNTLGNRGFWDTKYVSARHLATYCFSVDPARPSYLDVMITLRLWISIKRV